MVNFTCQLGWETVSIWPSIMVGVSVKVFLLLSSKNECCRQMAFGRGPQLFLASPACRPLPSDFGFVHNCMSQFLEINLSVSGGFISLENPK